MYIAAIIIRIVRLYPMTNVKLDVFFNVYQSHNDLIVLPKRHSPFLAVHDHNILLVTSSQR